MKLDIPEGTYVAAVSGGVDSMTLLYLIAKEKTAKPHNKYIIAHFNHGIREDSRLDEELVIEQSKLLGFLAEVGHGQLGIGASEDAARQARYLFLKKLADKYKANQIITAHHQDDLVETAIINLLRGTDRRGLSAIADNQQVLRPMLRYTKQDILDYAKNNGVPWREDSSNSDTTYLRNYIRQEVVDKMSNASRTELINNINTSQGLNRRINNLIATISQSMIMSNKINRQQFTQLPPEVGGEVVVYWVRALGLRQVDKKLVNRLNIALRTAKAGTVITVKKPYIMKVELEEAIIIHTD